MNSVRPMAFAEPLDLNDYAQHILSNSSDPTDRSNAQAYLAGAITEYDYFSSITYRLAQHASQNAIIADRPNIYSIAQTQAKAEVNRERINYVDPTFAHISDDVNMIYDATVQNTEMIGDLATTVNNIGNTVNQQGSNNWWSNLLGGITGGFAGGFGGFIILAVVIFLVFRK